jgi:hypothetical protein
MASPPIDCARAPTVSGGDKEHASDYRDLSDEEVYFLVKEINRAGYAVLPQYVGPEEIDQLRVFVRETVASAGGGYAALTGYAPIANTSLGAMATSASLKSVFRRVYELAASRPAKNDEYHQVLRCLTGETGLRHSMQFHFDSYLVTGLLPIEVPTGKQNGELILLRNVRPIRARYVTNLADKVLLDNPLTQYILRNIAARHADRFVRIPLKPGDLYFFWGYRSVHTNAPSDTDKVRATALFHFGDPHCDSALKKLLGR